MTNKNDSSEPNSGTTHDHLTKALNGEIKLDVMGSFKQAHELTKSSFGVFSLSALILFVIVLVCFSLTLSLLEIPIQDYQSMASTDRAILDIVLIFVLSPLLTGMMMMGINKARGRAIDINDLFKWLSITFILALGSLISSVLVQVGLVFLVIPGLYLGIATTFTLPLIADLKMSPMRAIMLSIRMVNRYLLPMSLFFVISLVMILLAAFTFIGLVWAIPVYFNAKGILYDQLFGNDMPTPDDSSGEGALFDA